MDQAVLVMRVAGLLLDASQIVRDARMKAAVRMFLPTRQAAARHQSPHCPMASEPTIVP